jgi:hypothetical protein
MAKKKATPPPAVKSGLPENRVVIVHLKGSQEFADWLEGIHKRTHIAKATLFRLAISDWAKRNGHPEAPEI